MLNVSNIAQCRGFYMALNDTLLRVEDEHFVVKM